MTVEQLQEKIQAYLDGTMPATEIVDFEKQIKASESLAEEVRKYRQMSILAKHQPLIEAKSILDAVMADIVIEPDYGHHAQYFKKSIWENALLRWGIGIATVILVAFGFYFYQNQQNETATALPNKSVLTPMENMIGFAPDDQSIAARGMQAYDKKDYPTAIQNLSAAIEETPNDNSLGLYLAISYLLDGQNTKAEVLLREMIKTEDLTTIPAKWYLALSLLQQNKKIEAHNLLRSIEMDTIFGDRVRGLLDQ
jgi:tetratricopeptide (TPR) repeat protein